MSAIRRPSGYYDTSHYQTLAIIYTKWQWIAWIGFLVFFLLFPLFASSYLITVAIIMCTIIIAVVGLNIVVGSTGLLNIAQSAFMAVGAFCSAILMSKAGINFFPALLAAGFMGSIVGVLFGAPSLRIKGFYVGLATLAAYFIIIWILMDWFGGSEGHMAPRPEVFGFVFKSDASYYYLVFFLTVTMSLFAQNLFRSPVGRALVAIRDHDIAAEILGIDIYRYKLLSFAIGSFYAGIAGSLQGHFCSFTNIEAFPFEDSIWLLGMVLVGGMGSVLGSVFGAVSFIILEEGSSYLIPVLVSLVPSLADFVEFGATLKYLSFSTIIILFVVLEPHGMAHRWNLIKASFRIYPFDY